MNIIFDLGGVVFNWKPEPLIRRLFDTEQEQHKVHTLLFKHDDWLDLDRGTLSKTDAARRAAQRTGIAEERIMLILDLVPQSLTPIQPTIDLMYRLKHAGHRIYVLSNMQMESIAYLESQFDFWHLVDGRVISCRIKHIKPEREIFDHLLNQYQIDPADTIFIDDTAVNLVTAAGLGLRTIAFSDPDQCKSDLQNMGVI